MKKCVIYFDPSLNEHEISQRIEAIRLIHGIEHIETPLTDHKISPPPQAMRPPQMGQPPQYPPQMPQGMPGMPQMPQGMPGMPQMGMPRPGTPGMNIPTEGEASKHVINQSLRWGLEQGIIRAEQIEKLEAQQLVDLAMKLLDQMPEDKKRELGSSLG